MIKTRLIALLSHARKYIFFIVLWQWLALLTQITAVFTVASFMERLYTGSVTDQIIVRSVLIIMAAITVRYICERMKTKNSFLACTDVKRILREKIYGKILRLGASYKEKVASSEIVQVTGEGVEQLETYFGKYLPQLFYSLLAPVTLFIVLSRISMKASAVLLICVPLIPVSIVVVQKIAKRLLNKYWSVYTGLGDSFLENLQGLTTLKIYQADQKKADEMDEEAQEFRRITMKVLTMQLNSTSVMDIVAYGGAAAGMTVAVMQFIHGDLSLSGVITIILLASEFFLPLRLLGSFFHIAMNGMAASDKIFRILDLPEEISGTEILQDGNVDIEMNNVCFRYEKEREILKGIYLSLKPGTLTSLVGESGCGKSTVAGILTGENHGYDGNITVNQILLDQIQEESLLKHIIRVRHNSYLFKGTVEDNLRMGKTDASSEEMNEVLKAVNMYDFLKSQNGLQMEILERGENLSGGQRQRLVIARALLKDGDMYIFDEATSNIDIESEELIMKVIHKLAKTKTVLLISHRLANVVSSDQICFMKDGMITERGTHEQLMRENGDYRHLYESQMELERYGMEEAE